MMGGDNVNNYRALKRRGFDAHGPGKQTLQALDIMHLGV
jgi:hypothetical protein